MSDSTPTVRVPRPRMPLVSAVTWTVAVVAVFQLVLAVIDGTPMYFAAFPGLQGPGTVLGWAWVAVAAALLPGVAWVAGEGSPAKLFVLAAIGFGGGWLVPRRLFGMWLSPQVAMPTVDSYVAITWWLLAAAVAGAAMAAVALYLAARRDAEGVEGPGWPNSALPGLLLVAVLLAVATGWTAMRLGAAAGTLSSPVQVALLNVMSLFMVYLPAFIGGVLGLSLALIVRAPLARTDAEAAEPASLSGRTGQDAV